MAAQRNALSTTDQEQPVAEKGQGHPLVVLEQQLESRLPEFAKALPEHMPPERFKRVILTAVQNNPGLMRVERRSFFNACMKAAQDGLLPDGREGAIVEYNDRQRGPIAQWMPMIAGLRKKVRNSGEIADWNAYVVFENDEFEFELGDTPFIKHKPTLTDPGKVIAAYSVAVFKTGEKSREVMSIAQIEKVRSASRAKDSERGPWKQWFEEMARKTVARRHSKVLPMSTDLDDLLRRDDDLYDMEGAREEGREKAKRPGLTEMLDQIAQQPRAAIAHDPETGEVLSEQVADADVGGDGTQESGASDSGETVSASGEDAGAAPKGEAPASDDSTDQASATAKEDAPAAVSPSDPDYQKGLKAAGNPAVKKCLDAAIVDDPTRHAAWKAGFAAGRSA